MARRVAAAVAPRAADPGQSLVPPAPAWDLARLSALLALPPALGLVLWRAAHDVPVWLGLPAAARGQACQRPTERVRARFAAARRDAPELAGALDALWELPCDPAAMEPARLADALGAAAAWAEERGLLPAAIPLAEAAAAVQPESAARCNVAGRVCRRAAEHTRAEQWYDRGIGLAKRSGNHTDYMHAQLGFGASLQDRGKHGRAVRHYLRAARRAERAGRRPIAAEAYHDLLGMVIETGATEKIFHYASRALANLKIHDPLLPSLVHNVAVALVRRQHYQAAAQILVEVAEMVPAYAVPLAQSTLARALGALQDRDAFLVLADKVLDSVSRSVEFEAAALVNLAEGARGIGDWERAEQLAREALAGSREKGDEMRVRDAEELLARITSLETPPPNQELPARGPFATLAVNLALRLRRWRPS